MHPETGTVAAVLAETNQVYFFRIDDLAAGKASSAAIVEVGATPCSIVYKKYANLQVFVVVCIADVHMYIIDANSFELLKTIPLEQKDNILVTASMNEQDPFLYYCFGDSMTGVASLRDLNNHGVVFQNSRDCAISASGTEAYQLSYSGASLRDSFMLKNSLTDSKPQFVWLNSVPASNDLCIPDPFDRYTTSGHEMYTADLAQKESTLDFTPRVFLKSKPIVIGTQELGKPPKAGTPPSTSRSIELRAASSNSFKKVGRTILLDYENAEGARLLPRTGWGNKHVEKRLHLFTDEARHHIVHTEGKTLHHIPLADMQLPDEPFLFAKLDGNKELYCNLENEFEIVPFDQGLEITFDYLPTGMKSNGNKLIWQPNSTQIGPATIRTTIKHGVLRRKLTFYLNVVFPHTALPFLPNGIAVDTSSAIAFVWDGPIYQYGKPKEPTSDAKRLAVVDLDNRVVIAQRQLPDFIGRIALTDEYILFLPWIARTEHCEVLRRDNLKRVTSLVMKSPITYMNVFGSVIIVQSQHETVIFDSKTLERLKVFQGISSFRNPDESKDAFSENGIFANGVLYGFNMQPKLFLHTGPILLMGNENQPDTSMFVVERMNYVQEMRASERYLDLSFTPPSILKAKNPSQNIQVELQSHMDRRTALGDSFRWRADNELSVTASGAVNQKQLLMLEKLSGPSNEESWRSHNMVLVTQQHAIVMSDGRLFRWQLPIPDTAVVSNDVSTRTPLAKLRLSPRQSELTLSSSKQTELVHEVQGSKLPVTFTLANRSGALELDKATGRIVIDNQAMLAEASRFLVNNARMIEGENAQEYADRTMKYVTQLLGKSMGGVPVAIPIDISVTDATTTSARLQYFLIAEIPVSFFVEKWSDAEKERNKKWTDGKTGPAEQKRASLPLTVPTIQKRRWKSNDGRFEIEAEFVWAIAGNVRLKRVDNGKIITVKLEMLSESDRKFVKSMERAPK